MKRSGAGKSLLKAFQGLMALLLAEKQGGESPWQTGLLAEPGELAVGLPSSVAGCGHDACSDDGTPFAERLWKVGVGRGAMLGSRKRPQSSSTADTSTNTAALVSDTWIRASAPTSENTIIIDKSCDTECAGSEQPWLDVLVRDVVVDSGTEQRLCDAHVASV